MVHVQAIVNRPHPGGTAEHERVRDYLSSQLRALGLEPVLQEATGVGTHNSVAGRVSNVVSRIPGKRPGAPAVLLVAHYDGVPAGPAAADDGAGVAVLLETARALGARAPLAHDVIVLFTDGEEAGLTGAAAFVREHPWASDVGRAFSPSANRQSRQWSLGYVVPPERGFELALTVRGGEPLEIDVIARSLGLPRDVAAALPPRTGRVVPVHAGDQTVVHRQIRL